MLISYDPYLVALSVTVAVISAYTCFHLIDSLTRLSGIKWKAALVGAAFSIGGGIWSTHFIGMLALNLPINMSYNVLGTLISALFAVSFTALALYFFTVKSFSLKKTVLCGTLMGAGISSMHFMGMGAIIANCVILYDPPKVVLSVIVGILASTLALYLTQKIKKRWEQVPSAIAMGLGIALMHYTGMFSATFTEPESLILQEVAALDRSVIAIVITGISFVIFASTFLLVTPGPDCPVRPEHQPSSPERLKISVQSPKGQLFFEPSEIICIHANGRYSEVITHEGSFFCEQSISKLDEALSRYHFLRVHRSHLVNLMKIVTLDHQKDRGLIRFSNGGEDTPIPVSRRKIEILKSEMKSLGVEM